LFVARLAQSLGTAEMPEQQLARLRPDAGDAVEPGGEAAAFAGLAAAAVRETVRLVARPRQNEQLRGVGLEPDRVLLSWQVEAIDQLVARDVLLLLGEADDVELMQPEVARGGERDAQLAAPAVDHEQIGKGPFRTLVPPLFGTRLLAPDESTRQDFIDRPVVVARGGQLHLVGPVVAL